MHKADLKLNPGTHRVVDPANYNHQAANTADPAIELPSLAAPFNAESKRVTSSLDHLEDGSNSKQSL